MMSPPLVQVVSSPDEPPMHWSVAVQESGSFVPKSKKEIDMLDPIRNGNF